MAGQKIASRKPILHRLAFLPPPTSRNLVNMAVQFSVSEQIAPATSRYGLEDSRTRNRKMRSFPPSNRLHGFFLR
jgi:hypothetical protein